MIQRIDDKHGKYVDIGIGWEKIVIDCDAELALIDPNYEILQVKQKFGGLRFYYKPSDSSDSGIRLEMDEVVRKYEAIADRTCEETGLPGVKMKSIGGWIKTLNPDHAEKNHPHARYAVIDNNVLQINEQKEDHES